MGILRELLEKEVKRLIKKHKTNNPFEIAKAENIMIFREPLGEINGYYNKYVRQKMIHINSNLDVSSFKGLFTCSHELCHAKFHPDSNTPFLRNNTLFSVNKLEVQANTFAAFMTIPKNILLGYNGFTLQQIACAEGIPVQALKLRFNWF